VQIYLLFYKSK